MNGHTIKVRKENEVPKIVLRKNRLTVTVNRFFSDLDDFLAWQPIFSDLDDFGDFVFFSDLDCVTIHAWLTASQRSQ